jgi:hypothetical protein
MKEALAFILVLLLLGCEQKFTYSFDGEKHILIINPEDKP